MTTVITDNKSRTGHRLLKNDDMDKTPLPIPEEELISLEEFKEHFEKRLYEELGLKITL
jgi:hypothetical protein